jgi:molybdate transport system ATP-binding protein/molybdate/tungstate transport system ATP-binding protein
VIELQNVSITSGTFSLKKVSFAIAKGQYAVLMGKTGQGKTTLLESICGLRRVQEGKILLHGRDITHATPADREIGYVPQDLALFPTLNVQQHLEFALRLRRRPASEIRDTAQEMAQVLGIEHLLRRSIAGLSGGESQRVALGRALSFRPSVLLLDEPLSALDEGTRDEMHELLRKVKTTTGVTTIHVTHSLAESESLADCNLWLGPNGIEQCSVANK